jgi:site-specific recombinase XerD
MMQTFTLLFYPKKRKNGAAYIYGRITIEGKRTEISTGFTCDPEKWSNAGGRPLGNSEESKILAANLLAIRGKVQNAFRELQFDGGTIGIDDLKNKLNGKAERQMSLIEIFGDHNRKIQELVGKDFAPGTLERYKTSLKHTVDFLKWKYNVSDIDIRKIDHAFITEYEFYLRSVRKCANNSAVKYIKNFGKIIRICLANGWIEKSPFANYKARVRQVERVFLSEEELQTIKDKDFKNERISNVRDIFLFSCYTGLAYADVKKLSTQDLVKGIDGETWIQTNRQKTDTKSSIPLLPLAVEMIEKYKDHPKCKNENRVLPILSNQKMNSYLKEIADLRGINKELTYHIARHTFATTVTLSNGVPIETVSKMLGHRDLKITQHYAKIIDRKVSDDMKILREKFKLQAAQNNGANKAY